MEVFSADGDQVVFLYRNNHESAENVCKRTGAISIIADVSGPNAVRDAVDQAVKLLGGLDVLVCNAGISITGLFTETTQRQWKEIMDTNLYILSLPQCVRIHGKKSQRAYYKYRFCVGKMRRVL